MKLSLLSWVLFVSLWTVANLWAAQKEVTLMVEGMTCGLCPFTVKSSLKKLDGVSLVTVSLKKKSAVVVYDETQVQVRDLIEATTQAGYHSKVASKSEQLETEK